MSGFAQKIKQVFYIAIILFACSRTIASSNPTTIQNQASATYEVDGQTLRIFSGTVIAQIQASSISLVKTASTTSASPGQDITFSLVPQASGLIISPVYVEVDGQSQPLVLIRDVIPANTTFSKINNAAGSSILYHIFGNPENVYTTSKPANTNKIDAIAFGFTQYQTVPVSFSVNIHSNADEAIYNTGSFYCTADSTVTNVLSNPVVVTLMGGIPPDLYFFNSAFTATQERSRAGNDLYVQASAAACNQDPLTPETRPITLTSLLTGDKETYPALETGPNTGIFRITAPTKDATDYAVVTGDGIMEILPGDTITATMTGCGATNATSVILIDPDGVVYDSKSDVPVTQAAVAILTLSGAPATVYMADGKTPAPSTVLTDTQGHFAFPVVNPGTYHYKVVPPTGYKFPSAVQPANLPKDRITDTSGSYGGNFTVLPSTKRVQFDIPVDSILTTNGGLFVEKTASKSEVSIPDFLTYAIQVKNVSGADVTNIVVQDNMPAGFSYRNGTLQINRTNAPNPKLSGTTMSVTIPFLASGSVAVITYASEVGPGALKSTGINTAQATAKGPPRLTSNVAKAVVTIDPGVFTDKSVIIGKIFVDSNTNQIQDAGEPGVPGVRIYMENGSYVITDEEGKYDFYGISPGTHVLKVDYTTLPKGAKLEVLNNLDAGYPATKFVEIHGYEMKKENFAILPSKAVIAQVNARRTNALSANEIDQALKTQLSPDGKIAASSDVKGLPASGLLNSASTNKPAGFSNGTNHTSAIIISPATPETNNADATTNSAYVSPDFKPLMPPSLDSANSTLPYGGARDYIPDMDLETSITNLNNKLGFIDFKDNDTLPAPQATIRVKGPSGAKLIVSVNGKELTHSSLGKQVEDAKKQLQAAEYIGIQLTPGTNIFTLKVLDPFGNSRGTTSVHVIAPDHLAKIKVFMPQKDQPADGMTKAHIVVTLTDAKGVPVTARTPLTLEASNGKWDVKDLDPNTPGTQVFIEGGKASFDLIPPLDPGNCVIVVSSGNIEDRETLPFLPDLRPMMAVGVIEGTMSLSKLNPAALTPARTQDGFTEELNSFALNGNNTANMGGRAAFFLKGKIKGDYLLTMGYDSTKSGTTLFRDIQPDQFYPVYGDSALRGFDAQSTSRLYIRIDKKRCFLLYGDMNTQGDTVEARGLGNYNRSLTGVKEHYEKNNIKANLWASQDSSVQSVLEVPANGTSGPYYFNMPNGIQNSEVVEILTRDRNQTAIILQKQTMTRFSDYEYDSFTGGILFKQPIPSLDPNLNPISIRITVENATTGNPFWIYGGDAQVKVNKSVEVGGSFVRDENPANKYQLYSANSTVKVTEHTFVMGEVAQSQSDLSGTGNAGRVEVRTHDDKTDARAYFAQTDPNFTNNSSSILPGQIEGGFKGTRKITPTINAKVEGIYTENQAQNTWTRGILASIEKTWGKFKAEIGIRHSDSEVLPTSALTSTTSTNGINTVDTVRAKVTAPVPGIKSANVYTEYEQDVNDSTKRTAAVGADYQIKAKTRLYARDEFISTLGSAYDLGAGSVSQNRAVAGFETEYMKDGQSFNEYRIRDSINGQDAEAATGLRNLFTLSDGIKMNTTFERVTPVTTAAQANEATAGTIGFEITRDPNTKYSARVEVRDTETQDTIMNSLGYARKINKEWTFLGKSIYMLTLDKNDSGEHDQARFQAGFAYRPVDSDKWNALMKYEYRINNDTTTASTPDHSDVQMFVGDINYQPTARLEISGHYALKYVRETVTGSSEASGFAHLIGGRMAYDITKRVDVGFGAYTLANADFSQDQYAIGPQVGILFKKNIRVVLGYNVTGFHDRDLSEGYTNPGFFVSFRMKFDETFFHKSDE